MPKRTKEQAMQTRQQILDVALNLFFEKSYSDVRINDIAERIGYTKGAVYWHFKNKDDILYTLIVETFATMAEQSKLLLSHLDSFKSIREYYKDVFRCIRENEKFSKLNQILVWKRGWPDEMQQKVNEVINIYREREREEYYALIKKEQNNGHLDNNIDPMVLTQLIMAILHGIATLQIVGFIKKDFAAQLDLLFDVFEQSLCIEDDLKHGIDENQ